MRRYLTADVAAPLPTPFRPTEQQSVSVRLLGKDVVYSDNAMRANIIHTDLNPCGGAEQVALGTIQALVEMNFDVELTTAREPNISRLKCAFGAERVGRLFNKIKRINSLGMLLIDANGGSTKPGQDDEWRTRDYDININTHADMLPYFLPSFSRRNTIAYCHFPVAIDLIDSHDVSYFAYLTNSKLIDEQIPDDTENRGKMWRDLRQHYLLMLGNSLLITNSNFSMEAILTTLASENHAKLKPLIISPPVNVDEFRPALSSSEKSDHILVISRVSPSKMLENAIRLASILKRKKIGKGMIIAGNLMEDDPVAVKYYDGIIDMIQKFEVSDYVTVETNAPLTRLKTLLTKCKVYFHPLPGEPFGISIIEAMSAGLIAIVPDTGGHTEVVSKKYQFHTLLDAPAIISSALNATQEERVRVSNSVAGFSLSRYLKDFQRVVRETLAIPKVPSTDRASSED